MANEASIRMSLRVRKGELEYQSRPTTFRADVTGQGGPTPGTIRISTDGTDVDLSEIVIPGWCHLRNLDPTNSVQWGIWEPATSKFYPVGQLLPGESALLRLSPNLLEEYDGTGTGTSAPNNGFRFKADTASCLVLIEVLER